MDRNGRRIIYLFAGGYLVYLGISLISDVVKGLAQNTTVSLVGGIVFVLFGGGLVIDFIRASIKSYKEQDIGQEESVETTRQEDAETMGEEKDSE